MAEPSQRARRHVVAGLLLGAIGAGCSFVPAAQGDPNAPVLVTGRVLDVHGVPVANATMVLVVNDFGRAVNVGDVVPVVFQQTFVSNPDGSFTIHLAPNAALESFAAKNGGSVNFELMGRIGNLPAVWAFPRELTGQLWSDELPFVELRPIGSGSRLPAVPLFARGSVAAAS